MAKYKSGKADFGLKNKLGFNTLSALIITYNEEANIYRALNSIRWIPHVLVLDSGSTDRTIEIVSQFSNTSLLHRPFDTFAGQCNYGLSHLTSEWVLSLDADYVLPQELGLEILNLLTHIQEDNHTESIMGYSIGFKYCINGKPIRSGLLPPRICLYKRLCAQYIDEGHGHRILIDGDKGTLHYKMLHDDRKPLDVWLMNQKKYQATEAKCLSMVRSSDLPVQDLLRKHTFLAPFVAFLYSYFIKGGFLDGREGMIYALQRFVAETLLYLNIQLPNDVDMV